MHHDDRVEGCGEGGIATPENGRNHFRQTPLDYLNLLGQAVFVSSGVAQTD